MVTLLAHEWIARNGGSENVLQQMQMGLSSDTRLFCLWNDDVGRFPDALESVLSRRPFRGKKAATLGLMPEIWRRVPVNDVDRVVVSSHAFAHHLASHAARANVPAFAYIHSPARYLWAPELDARGSSAPIRLAAGPLRRIDRHVVSSEVSYRANSRFVAKRILASWGVEVEVLYPPVDVEAIELHAIKRSLPAADQVLADGLPSEFVLGASRLVGYKRVKSAIRVGELMNLPVVVAGDGPEMPAMRRAADSASVPVTVLGRVSNPLLRELYFRTCLYVFMPIEDFGIMPVEAMAAGAPVLVNRVGGAAESVEIVQGGTVADPDDDRSLLAGASAAVDRHHGGNAHRTSAFSNESFRKQFIDWVGRSPAGVK